MFQCSLSLCRTARNLHFSCTGGSTQICYLYWGRYPRCLKVFSTASRGGGRDTSTVSSIIERQRYARPPAKRTCYSGAPGCSLRLHSRTRGQGDTSPCRLSLWSVGTVSLSENRKEKWFLEYAGYQQLTGEYNPVLLPQAFLPPKDIPPAAQVHRLKAPLELVHHAVLVRVGDDHVAPAWD